MRTEAASQSSLRRAIHRAMAARGWSNYRLIQELRGRRPEGGSVPGTTAYQFLRGERAISSDDLEIIFTVLGIEMKEKK